MRIKALDSGTYFHRTALTDPRVAAHLAGTIYLPDLEETHLDDADLLIATCRTPPARLKAKQPVMEAFVRRGGTLAIMGETDPHEWWPHHRFTPLAIDFTWWLKEGGDSGLRFPDPGHPLFARVAPEHCQWHFHGVFEPARGETIIRSRAGDAILIDDRETLAPGRVIATGLDPFYHHGAGFMPNATRFLLGFLDWLNAGAPAAQQRPR